MRIFISAVAGTAMGSLAGLLQELGHDVAGSDTAFYPPMGPALKEWGVRCFEGFDPAVLSGRSHGGLPPELLIVGNVCRKDNPQALAAERLGIERIHLADALKRFALPGTSSLVVAGTHGKTTTSCLCAHLLDKAGLEPGYLIGGVPLGLERSFRAAGARRLLTASTSNRRATPFVLEGDEYDTAYWEKTAKFLHYNADIAIITSIEHDHIDIYPEASDYEAAFRRFCTQLPSKGLLIAYAGDAKVVELSKLATCEVAYYGLLGEQDHGVSPHWLAAPAGSDDSGTSFDLFAGGVLAGRFVCPMSGSHNLKNSVAALAACAHGYGVPLKRLHGALAEFQGVKRRQEVIGRPQGVVVYDDFAHHPTAVQQTLQGLRNRHPKGKLIAVFEPRSATACRRHHQQAYERAFDAASHVIIAPVGRQGLAPQDALDVEELVLRIGAEQGQGRPKAYSERNVQEIIDRIRQLAQSGDTVAILSNGAFDGIHARLLEALDAP